MEPKARIVHADSLAYLKTLPDNSIDSVVCDPPYGLSAAPDVVKMLTTWLEGKRYGHAARGGFMGKSWDSFVPGPELWRECFRVLKPGGHLLAFAGTRTQDLMGLAIRLAGFEIRDSLHWMYGCLSEDSEILIREKGWVHYHSANVGDHALAFHLDGSFEWQPIEEVFEYAHEGTLVRLKSEDTDQLLTSNHRVVLEGAASIPALPDLLEDVQALQGTRRTSGGRSLFKSVQRESTRRASQDARAQGSLGLDGGVVSILPPEDDWRVEPGLEGRRYRFQEAWELRGCEVRAGAEVGATDGAQGWVRHGTPTHHGGTLRLPVDAYGSRQPRGRGPEAQPPKEPHALAGQSDAQVVRMGQGDRRLRLSSSPVSTSTVEYAGMVWCVRVSTGAFVARRNGQAFVTGNSGFPKSLDVSKSLDAKAGHVRGERGAVKSDNKVSAPNYERTPKGSAITDEAKKWEGWGTGLAPSHEPIVVARKAPLMSISKCVQEHGTGAINIDATRVAAEASFNPGGLGPSSKTDGWDRPWKHNPEMLARQAERAEVARAKAKKLGRWPKNVLLTHAEGCEQLGTKEIKSGSRDSPLPMFGKGEGHSLNTSSGKPRAAMLGQGYADANGKETVESWKCVPGCPVAELDAQSFAGGIHSAGAARVGSTVPRLTKPSTWQGPSQSNTGEMHRLGDEGGASRFFPCFKYEPKVDGTEREQGCWSLPKAEWGDKAPVPQRDARPNTPSGNHHPTVKPVSLMLWLVKLVTPPDGTVLDPFTGSGSTGIAALRGGFRFLGIEREAAYVEIARRRIQGDNALRSGIVAVELVKPYPCHECKRLRMPREQLTCRKCQRRIDKAYETGNLSRETEGVA